MDFEGKVGIVTGASSGIGRATALALASRGAGVVALARRRDLLEDLMGLLGRDVTIEELSDRMPMLVINLTMSPWPLRAASDLRNDTASVSWA